MNGFNYAEAFTQAYQDAVNQVLASLNVPPQVIAAPPAPIAPPDPLPYDVLPEPGVDPLAAAGASVLYGGVLLPFGATEADISTILAMGGNLSITGAVREVPEDSVFIVDALGNIHPRDWIPGGQQLPLLPELVPPELVPPIVPPELVPPELVPPELELVPPSVPGFLPPLPIGLLPPEEIDMSLFAGLAKFGSSSLGQQLTGALVSRVLAPSLSSGSIKQLPAIGGMVRQFPGASLPALPGAGFTSGRGFPNGQPGKIKFKRRRTNPTNVHALRRALRRVEGFIKIEKRVDKIVRRIRPRVAARAAKSGFVKKR